MEFTIGDTVKLKSGSALMTIAGRGKDAAGNAQVTCTWMDKDLHQQYGAFPIAAVERAAVPSPKRVALGPLRRDRSGDGTGWMSR
jgi:uncharacterized protein YodC (DUF2158 family)